MVAQRNNKGQMNLPLLHACGTVSQRKSLSNILFVSVQKCVLHTCICMHFHTLYSFFSFFFFKTQMGACLFCAAFSDLFFLTYLYFGDHSVSGTQLPHSLKQTCSAPLCILIVTVI